MKKSMLLLLCAGLMAIVGASGCGGNGGEGGEAEEAKPELRQEASPPGAAAAE